MLLFTRPRGGVTIERRLLPSPSGRVALEQTFRGDGVRTVVTHAASVLTEIAVQDGTMSFPLAAAEVVAPGRFLLVLPPRSVLPMRFARARVDSRGTAVLGAMSPHDAPFLVPDAGLAAADAIGHDVPSNAARLDADRAVSLRITRARRELHDLVMQPAPVRRAARRVGLAPESLARAFARAYTVSPKQYCQRARVFEAVLRLLSGARVVDACFTAGFSDLGRFYAAFRAVVGATPGLYAQVRKRQDRRA
jgi:AraC-like DNA-binding protein